MVGEPPSEKEEKEEKETERKERSEASLDWGDGSSILQSHSEDSNVTGVDSSETRNKLRLLKRYRSPSAWFGVKTACIAGKERVTELRLSRNGLSGVSPLSPMLCRLEWLTHLDLSFNTFQSIRPPENERRIDTNPICPKGGITGWILLQKNGEPPHVTSRKHLDAISTGLRRLKYLNLSHNGEHARPSDTLHVSTRFGSLKFASFISPSLQLSQGHCLSNLEEGSPQKKVMRSKSRRQKIVPGKT